MRLRVEEVPSLGETEVLVRCATRDAEVVRIENALGLFTQTISARKDGRTFRLSPADVFYFEAVDDRTYAYLRQDVVEIDPKLAALESMLADTTFLRVNRTTIADTAKIASFRSALNGRMEARLANGETVVISRAYVAALRNVLKGGRP